ncbi:hypothetical protein [Gracilimonas amylolytica]|uniref:hypothetical protein n=1 Tax=Gracilimonas amylolytica TaxID=1749045 RepID=UPI000CD83511|nr:hypothetical protein [Gracilimonas amylolytica]
MNNFTDKILEDANGFRKSNLLRHHYVVQPLLNFTKYSVTKQEGIYPSLIEPKFNFGNIEPPMLELMDNLESPRRIKFYEACLSTLDQKIASYNTYEKSEGILEVSDIHEIDILKRAYERYKRINTPDYIPDQDEFYQTFPEEKTLGEEENITDEPVIEISCKHEKSYKKDFKVALANTVVDWKNQASKALLGQPDLSNIRRRKFAEFINKFEEEYIGSDNSNTADLLVLPEISVPHAWVFELAGFCSPRQKAMIFGTEHIKSCNVCFNFIFTILPIEVETINGHGKIKDAIVIPRLKNHYSHEEKQQINGHQMAVAVPKVNHYDLFHWCDLYFTAFYCFELCDIVHRSWFRGKVDFIAAPEYNSDTNYFSSIVESTARDLSCYVVQVNSSDYGDSRVTIPAKTEARDPLKVKGGKNDVVLIESINFEKFREHQFKTYPLQKEGGKKNKLKPSPPDFDVDLVKRRMKNLTILDSESEVC